MEWAKGGIWGLVLGIGAVSAASPPESACIWETWFFWLDAALPAPLLVLSAAPIAGLRWGLRRLPVEGDAWAWTPFCAGMAVFAAAIGGLAYSFCPCVVPERLTIVEAASAPGSLFTILIGT